LLFSQPSHWRLEKCWLDYFPFDLWFKASNQLLLVDFNGFLPTPTEQQAILQPKNPVFTGSGSATGVRAHLHIVPAQSGA
jgi:hypothetical protein